MRPRHSFLTRGLAGAPALALFCALAGPPTGAVAAETPSWEARRHEWLAARAARSEARWSGTSEAIEKTSRLADRAESLYVVALEAWAVSVAGESAGSRRAETARAPHPELREAALDLLEHGETEAAVALLDGPLRHERALLPVRARSTGLRVAPDSGLALLDWPPDRRASGVKRTRWDRVERTAPDEADAAYLVAASLAESTGANRVMRAALWRLARHQDTREAYARLKLARALARGGELRLAAQILASAVLHDDEERLLLADLRADIRLKLADSSGAAVLLVDVTRDADYGAAQRVAASRRALPWLQGSRLDSLGESRWLEFVRSLGDLGETETAIATLRRRRIAAPDSTAGLARAEVEAGLYARAKRHGDAAAAYGKLLRQVTLPAEKRARYALGVARAKRAMGDFVGCDSAFLAAVALDSLGATGATAAWERAREWEDRGDAREAARTFEWSRRYLRDPVVLRSRTIHAAIAWWRAGEPDSAVAEFGNSTAEFAVFWKSRVLAARGDSAGAERELRRLPPGDSWSYEGVRAFEELARSGGPAPAAPKSPSAPSGAEKAKAGGAPTRDSAPLSARVFGAIGATQWMMDDLRECAGVAGPRGRACTEELEARGIFRAGRTANVPADRLDYAPAYPEAVLDAARREALSPSLIWAIMRQESAYLRGVRSKAGAIGLLQLLPSTASRLAGARVTEQDLYDSDRNVRLGARYLRALVAEFGDARAATAAYNAGEDVVRRWVRDFGPVDDFWVERIPYRETRDYVRQVYTIWKRYERMYGTPPTGGKDG